MSQNKSTSNVGASNERLCTYVYSNYSNYK